MLEKLEVRGADDVAPFLDSQGLQARRWAVGARRGAAGDRVHAVAVRPGGLHSGLVDESSCLVVAGSTCIGTETSV